MLRLLVPLFHLHESRRVFQLRADVVGNEAERASQKKRDAPAPLNNGGLGQNHFQHKGHRGTRQQARGRRCRDERAIAAALLGRGVLSQKHGGTRVLASHREPLHAAQHEQQDGGGQADGLVGRQAADEESGAGHQQNRDGQRLFATLFVAHASPEHGAERTEDEGQGEDGKGHQSRVHLGVRKEDLANRNGEVRVGGIIEPLDEVSQERRGSNALQIAVGLVSNRGDLSRGIVSPHGNHLLR